MKKCSLFLISMSDSFFNRSRVLAVGRTCLKTLKYGEHAKNFSAGTRHSEKESSVSKRMKVKYDD